VSNEIVPDHLLCLILDLLRSLADLDTSLEATSEFTFATATSLNLSLKDQASLV
jgi:hypothetical protein